MNCYFGRENKNMASWPGNRGRWRRILLAVAVSMATAADVAGQDDLNEPVPMWNTELPAADELLQRVIQSFPTSTMQIQATIKAKQANGRLDRTIYAEVLMSSRAGLYSSMYTLSDALGGDLEQLVISREPERQPVYRYRKGNPLVDAPVPNLFERVQGTDLTWIDVSLAYLWWPEGETVGTDRLRGRFCYVVELPAPQPARDTMSKIHIWVDPKINMLLKAEAHNYDNEVIRRMTIESFKKVDGIWFIKDIDIYSFPARHKTSLRVQSIKTFVDLPQEEELTAPTMD